MGLFGRKKKELKPNRVIQTMNEKQIVTIRCPECKAILFEGYYLTIQVDKDITNCPHCNSRITLN